MPLKTQIKAKKKWTLSFKVSIQDIDDLDNGKNITINIKGDTYTIKRKSK